MSGELRRLAASAVVTGFHDEPDEAFYDSLEEYPFSGFLFFERHAQSVERLRGLTDGLRARYSALPPLLTIDQEGGRVARLRNGVEPMPSAAEIGNRNDPSFARHVGERCASDLRRAGCNLDFAPVLDLAVDPGNTVIGSRSFGADPALVTTLGRAFAAGLQDGGVVATFKHFPGHGATSVDSHVALPVVEVDEATLRARDLVPFAALAPQAAAVMTGHVLVPAFDSARPATLSKKILQGLLRTELGFRGVCFSDCLEMKAIADGVGSVDGAVLAIRAGCDVVTVSHEVGLARAIVDRLAAEAARDAALRLRLEESATRTESLRARVAPPLDAGVP